MRVELVYMQYNISDSQVLFWCSVISFEMASLDTLFLCSARQQAWLFSYLVLNFFTKTKAFVLVKLFSLKKECWKFRIFNIYKLVRPWNKIVLTRDVEYSVHKGQRGDNLCKNDAQVDIYLKLSLIKSNPLVVYSLQRVS